MYEFSETLQTALNANNPQRVLIEFASGEQFTNEDVVMSTGVQVRSEFNSETDLTIGLCPSSEIQFAMLNDVNQLADFEFGEFTAYLGARIDTGTPEATAKTATFTEGGSTALYEFAPLGVFIAKRPNVVRTNIIDVDANDRMTLFDVDMPGKTALNLTYPTTLGTLAQKMCEYLNVPLKSATFLNSTLAVSEEPEVFESSTMREVIGMIAEAACSIARFDRTGNLEFVWFNPVNKTYDEHDYKDFTQYWYETKSIDKLHIRNGDSTAEYIYGNGNNAYMIQDNPFLRQPD